MRMDMEISKGLYANIIGELAIMYLESLQADELLSKVESQALALIAEIKTILDDDCTGDPECFYRIEKLVEAFYERGIQTTRHDS